MREGNVCSVFFLNIFSCDRRERKSRDERIYLTVVFCNSFLVDFENFELGLLRLRLYPYYCMNDRCSVYMELVHPSISSPYFYPMRSGPIKSIKVTRSLAYMESTNKVTEWLPWTSGGQQASTSQFAHPKPMMEANQTRVLALTVERLRKGALLLLPSHVSRFACFIITIR